MPSRRMRSEANKQRAKSRRIRQSRQFEHMQHTRWQVALVKHQKTKEEEEPSKQSTHQVVLGEV